MKRAIFITLTLLISIGLVGCGNSQLPIDKCVWQFENAITVASVKSGHLFAADIDNAEETPDERVKYISCTLDAGDGRFSIIDKTNGLIFSGTYRLQSVQPEVTIYTLDIGGSLGRAVTGTLEYADGSKENTLIVSIGDYTLNFFEKK